MENLQNIQKTKIIILAAGQGKRMESDSPKVLAMVKGKAMIKYTLEAIEQSGIPGTTGIVVGYQKEKVIMAMGPDYDYAIQEELLGTGHAVSAAKIICTDMEHIVVLPGDQPFVTGATIKNLLEKHLAHKTKITFATTVVPDFKDWHQAFIYFGRVLREDGQIVGIKEYKDATEEERQIKEVNAGCYAFNASWLWENLKSLKNANTQKEYYLTELLEIAKNENEKIESIEIAPHEALGANSKEELDILEKFAK